MLCSIALALQARAEQDAYLAQLEAQGELEGIYGQGVQVIQPEPGMVVKSKSADAKTRVYINVCTCSKVSKKGVSTVRGTSAVLPCGGEHKQQMAQLCVCCLVHACEVIYVK